MANIYVRSGALGTPDGTTWGTAWLTLAASLTAATNADTIWVADDHAEAPGTTITLTLPTSPGLRILCANTHVTQPPTGLAATATITSGATTDINFNGFAYFYGITFNYGSSGTRSIIFGQTVSLAAQLVFDNCKFSTTTTGTGNVHLGSAAAANARAAEIIIKNSSFKFGAAAQSINPRCCNAILQNISIDAAGSAPTTLFIPAASGQGNMLVEASDLSGKTFTNLINVANGAKSVYTFRNCKLPSGINVTTGTNFGPSSNNVFMHDCDSADTHIRFSENRYEGTITQQTSTLTRTGGATQADSTAFSMLMAGNANSVIWAPLISPEFAIYNTAVGSSMTATVEILRDNATNLKDSEVWLEIQYLSTSGFPQGSISSDRMTNVLSTPADQDASSVTWDTTGMGSPNKQKLVATFTPQEAGYVIARVMLAANTSIYVDPYLTLV